jgi:electron transfer flavoprotein alpha subunit
VKIAVFVEVVDGQALPDGLALIGQLASPGHGAEAIVAPSREEAAVFEAVEQAGASLIHAMEGPGLQWPLTLPYVEAISRVWEQERFDVLALPSTTLSVDVATALAYRMRLGINYELEGIEVRDGSVNVTRVADSGDQVLHLSWQNGPGIALFRRGAFVPTKPDPANHASVSRHAWQALTDVPDIEVLEVEGVDSVAAGALAHAEIIVAAGRGMGGIEGVDDVRALAQSLGGQPAASLAAVDRGWAPHSMQVGQTGTLVRPLLYIACGISGQMQHRVGMERSATIISINTDEEAPLHQIADLVVVGDARAIVPELSKRVLERRLRHG